MTDKVENLIKYIRSSFNMGIDADAKQYSDNSLLKLMYKSPIYVYVAPIVIPELKNKTDEYKQLVRKALDIYSAALLDKIKFEIVDYGHNFDFEINWSKTNRQYTGMCYAPLDWYPKQSMVIGIADKDNTPIIKENVYHVILHELGHALGLGHSPNDNDVMSCCGDYVTNLSPNDIFVLQLIYSIGDKRTFFEEEEYIYKCINEYITESNKKEKKPRQENKSLTTLPINKESLWDKLDNISDVKKYRILLQDIKLAIPQTK